MTSLLLWIAGCCQLFAANETVAISYFDNTSGDVRYNCLSRGISDMLITELAEVDGLTIVERKRLDILLQEIKLGESKYFDPATAQKLGKGLGAHFILTGAFIVIGHTMRIDARLVEVKSGAIFVAQEITGTTANPLDLIKQLGRLLAEGLKIPASRALTLPNNPTAPVNLNAVISYSNALDLEHQGRGKEAEKLLETTVNAYPQFTIAKNKLGELRKFLHQFEQNQTRLRQEKLKQTITELNSKLDEVNPNNPAYGDQIQEVWDLLFKANKMRELLWFNNTISKTYPKQLEERYLYYTLHAARLLKEYDLYTGTAQKYLSLFPESPMVTLVSSLYESTLDEIERIENGKIDLEKKLAAITRQDRSKKETLFAVAAVYEENDQYIDAIQVFRQLLVHFELAPAEEKDLLTSLFDCHLQVAQFNEARNVLKRFQTNFPSDRQGSKMMELSLTGMPE